MNGDKNRIAESVSISVVSEAVSVARPLGGFGWGNFNKLASSLCLVLLGFAALAAPGYALADACLQSLTSAGTGTTVPFTVSTLNSSGVASFVQGTLTLQSMAQGKVLTSAAAPQHSNQLFSDRKSGSQPFAVSSADLVDISIPVTAAPQVTFTLVSHANGKDVFSVNCSGDGVLNGASTTVSYSIHVAAAQAVAPPSCASLQQLYRDTQEAIKGIPAKHAACAKSVNPLQCNKGVDAENVGYQAEKAKLTTEMNAIGCPIPTA
jgi:hypothetical protein